MELSAYALERKNVRMLNFACLAASLLLTAGVGAGYVSTPTRHNAPQLVDGIMYYGFQTESNSVDIALSSLTLDSEYQFKAGSDVDASLFNRPSDANLLFMNFWIEDGSIEVQWVTSTEFSWDYEPVLNVIYSSEELVIDLYQCPYYLVDDVPNWTFSTYDNGINAVSAFNGDSNGILTVNTGYTGTNVTDAITDGLGAIVPMGGALVTGFDAIALDDGALTPVVTFGFVLMGLGISVGIVKKCFNWVTGRHGM